MDSKYSIDTSEGLVRVQVWGELRADTLIKLMGRIAADPRHRTDMSAIIDLREAHGADDIGVAYDRWREFGIGGDRTDRRRCCGG